MAIKIGWFTAQTTADVRPVLDRVRMQAAKDDLPEGFRISRSKRQSFAPLRKMFGAKPPWISAVMLGWEFHAAPQWAQAVSAHLRCTTVSFFVFEGTWSYAIFDSGSEVLAMESYALPGPTMYGDSARAASLLGVESDLFARYEAALRQAVVEGEDDDGGDGPPPLPGDEHQPHDEWAHLDFARRFGAAYPDPDEGDEFRWGPNDPPVMNEAWTGLPERLPMPSEPAKPGGKEIDFDNFPSGDEPF